MQVPQQGDGLQGLAQTLQAQLVLLVAKLELAVLQAVQHGLCSKDTLWP